VWNRAASGATISRHTYVLNARGERTRADEVLPVLSQPLLAQTSRSTSYSYDALSRLVNAVDPDVSTTYAYDPVGNRTRRTRATASGTETLDYRYDRADRIQSAGGRLYTVDANGNIVSRSGPLGSDTFAYDQANRLVRSSLAGVDVVTYSYDGDGNRRSKGILLGLVGYALDVARPLPVVVADDERKYVWGSGLTHGRGLLGSVTSEGITRPVELSVFHADGLGSVRALTADDGTVFQTYRADEFGVPVAADSLGTSLQPFQYTGEQRDLETGFIYLRARYYAPEIGRLVTRDRWPGVAARPLTLNRSTYAANNPLRYRDPSGLAASSFENALDFAMLDVGPTSGEILTSQLPLSGSQPAARVLNPWPDFVRLSGGVAIQSAHGDARRHVWECRARPLRKALFGWRRFGRTYLPRRLGESYRGLLDPRRRAFPHGSQVVLDRTERERRWRLRRRSGCHVLSCCDREPGSA